MTLPEVNELFSTDDRCRQLLERLRWPEGVMCPRCKDIRVSRLKDYARYECVGCEYQFTVTSGTIFHDSHLPLPIWFLATLLLCEAKKGMSAHQLKRTIWGLHKGSYKTAWYLCTVSERLWRKLIALCLTVQSKWMKPTLAESNTVANGWAEEIIRNASLVFASVTVNCVSSMPKMPRAALWRGTSKRTSVRMLT